MKDRKRPKGKLLLGALALVFILGTGLLGDAFILTARAESQAKVTANSVKIRKGATTDSEMVGGADTIITERFSRLSASSREATVIPGIRCSITISPASSGEIWFSLQKAARLRKAVRRAARFLPRI